MPALPLLQSHAADAALQERLMPAAGSSAVRSVWLSVVCLSGILLSGLFLDLRNAQQLAVPNRGCSLPGVCRLCFCPAGGRAVAAAGLGSCLKPSTGLVLNHVFG